MDVQDDDSPFSFPLMEENVLNYWTKIDAFKESLRQSEGKPEFVFYDGPPFATGMPHYGHILAGTIKDVVTRFAHQTGHHVTRRFGWDCHGLPVEYEIDQKLGIKSKDDVLKALKELKNTYGNAIDITPDQDEDGSGAISAIEGSSAEIEDAEISSHAD